MPNCVYLLVTSYRSQTRCYPNGTKLCWPATWRIRNSMECYRRRQTTPDARQHH